MTDRVLYLLDLYYRDTISDDELNELKQEITTDELVKLKKRGQQVERAASARAADEFRDKLRRLDHVDEKPGATYRKYVILALIGIGVLLTAMYWNTTDDQPKHIDKTELFMAYAKPYQNIYMPKSRNVDAVKTTLQNAMSAYDDQRYTEARTFFNEVAQDSVEEGTLFYQAISLFMLEDFQESSTLFNQLTENEKYGVPSTWYLFLIALNQDQEAEVKELGTRLQEQKAYPKITRDVEHILSVLNN